MGLFDRLLIRKTKIKEEIKRPTLNSLLEILGEDYETVGRHPSSLKDLVIDAFTEYSRASSPEKKDMWLATIKYHVASIKELNELVELYGH